MPLYKRLKSQPHCRRKPHRPPLRCYAGKPHGNVDHCVAIPLHPLFRRDRGASDGKNARMHLKRVIEPRRTTIFDRTLRYREQHAVLAKQSRVVLAEPAQQLAACPLGEFEQKSDRMFRVTGSKSGQKPARSAPPYTTRLREGDTPPSDARLHLVDRAQRHGDGGIGDLIAERGHAALEQIDLLTHLADALEDVEEVLGSVRRLADLGEQRPQLGLVRGEVVDAGAQIGVLRGDIPLVDAVDRDGVAELLQLLDHLAEVLRVRGTLTTSGLDLREVAEQGDDLLAALEDRIGNTPADSLTLAVGLAGMVLPARHAWQQLVEVERARMT
jgi:hypothetical protein